MSEQAKEQTLAEQAPDSYECRVCGYVYEPNKGDDKRNVAPRTLFINISDDWRCPVCGGRKTQFDNIGASDAPSGFQDNLQYGFGVNSLTPRQKNILIFGGLVLGFLFFLSLYGLH
ncbi:MAG: rubredoxin [Symploca sp. SIO2G7]|nr:rubredoxin [Symploca sp. SIO2G7]